jgi:autotransporter adhesin
LVKADRNPVSVRIARRRLDLPNVEGRIVADLEVALAVSDERAFTRRTDTMPVGLASGADAVALGAGAVARGARSVALGDGSVADRDDAVSVGSDTKRRQLVEVAKGSASSDAINLWQLSAVERKVDTLVRDGNFDAISVQYTDASKNAVALGDADANGSATVIHNVAQGSADRDLVNVSLLEDRLEGIGLSKKTDRFFKASGDGEASASGARSVAGGRQAHAGGQAATAFGSDTQAGGANAFAAGALARADGANALALGQGAAASLAANRAGGVAAAPSTGDLAIGAQANARGGNAIAVGATGGASAAGAIAVGAAAAANAADGAALGTGASVAADAHGALALGAGSVADRDHAVSVGAKGATRVITNVRDAAAQTDGITVGQLRRETQGCVTGSARSPETA